MDSRARAVADTLIDFYAGFDSTDSESEQRISFEASLARLNDNVAEGVASDGDDGVTLDFTPLLLANGTTLMWLVEQLAEASGRSKEELVFDLRAFLDSQVE